MRGTTNRSAKLWVSLGFVGSSSLILIFRMCGTVVYSLFLYYQVGVMCSVFLDYYLFVPYLILYQMTVIRTYIKASRRITVS